MTAALERARRHGVLLAVLAVVAAFYFWLNAYDGLGSIAGDGLIYFLTARDYAPYWPADALAQACARTTQFPPVYALLLAASGAATHFWLAHELTALTLVAALIAFYAWLRTLSLERWQAAAGVALFAALPGTLRQSLFLHPEGLYLALVFGVLVQLARLEASAGAAGGWTAAALVAIAIVTRTVGVTLLPALGIVLLRQRPRGAIGMVLLAVTPTLLWAAWHRPPHPYGDALVEQYGDTSVAAVLHAMQTYVAATIDGLVDNVTDSARLHAIVLALGAVSLAIGAFRFVRLKADAWYLFGYLGVLALWPYPREAWRLSWVLLPLLLGYVLWGVPRAFAQVAALRPRAASALRLAPLAVLALIVLPGALLLVARATHPLTRAAPELRHLPEWYDPFLPGALWLAQSHLATVEGLREFGTRVPAGECIISTKDLIVAFYSGHPVTLAPGESLDDRAFAAALAQTGCRYLILLYGSGRAYSRPFYPRERLAGRLDVIAERRIDAGAPDERLVAQLAVLRP